MIIKSLINWINSQRNSKQSVTCVIVPYICREKRLECYATAYEFDIKSIVLRRWILIKTVVELLLPSIVFIALGFSSFLGMKLIIFCTLIIGALQLVLTTFSHIYHWDENYHYYIESKQSNYSMSDEFHTLYQNNTNPDFNTMYEKLLVKYHMRNEQDYKYYISEKHKLRGKRAAYAKYDEECPVCNSSSNKSKDKKCPNCGLRRVR